ncbi:MAG TPA: SOS response-associated peptidase [Burkholderiales bacterium]|nr:SOS response-associated peptidase [Burkholderiales bacterium]
MCGRYELHTPVEEVAREFDAMLTDELRDYGAHYNIAPSLRVPVVREGRHGRVLEAMTWGLVPSWSKNAKGNKPVNARAETLFDKPMFRNAILRRRCLLPANGYYEWRQDGARKQPFWVGMTDGSVFGLAGIWEYWRQEGHDPLITCAVIVTDANELLQPIHDRMPVIVRREDYARWLDPTLTDQAAIARMMRPVPANMLCVYPISPRVNNARNDDAQLIEPQHA